ncbi:MAG: hypothetical protein ACP5NF_00775 [Thermoanaerobaculum sp.]
MAREHQKPSELSLDNAYFAEKKPGCAGLALGFLLGFAAIWPFGVLLHWQGKLLLATVVGLVAGLAVSRYGDRAIRWLLGFRHWW